ncbi:MAG: hypothetical protein E6H91_02690 [Chloroflexi bacterium]|nr:MAG: hypothetical protein E6H91_02690 [Chloroflexota bacterium]
MTNRPHLLTCGLMIFLVAMLLLSGDVGPSAAGGLAVAVGPAPGDDPTLPPLSAVLRRESYEMIDTLADPVSALDPPPGGKSNSTLMWGYEANFANSRILSYNIAPYAGGPECVPDAAAGGPTGNGRGVAYDPLDGNLWITRLTFFVGDGLIHKVTPPQVTPGTCPQVSVIPFGDGLGGTIQDDIGALDLDQGSKHIWAAGYAPIIVGLAPPRNYFYLVDRDNGKILQSCFIPANLLNGAGFNDSLSYARLPGLPGSGQYLLTDGGEFFAAPLKVIDTASCHDGKQATIVATFQTTHGLTGIDFESPGLLSSDPFFLYNDGDQPFTSSTVIGPTTATFGLEDISFCGFRAKFGGDGNDGCPY